MVDETSGPRDDIQQCLDVSVIGVEFDASTDELFNCKLLIAQQVQHKSELLFDFGWQITDIFLLPSLATLVWATCV